MKSWQKIALIAAVAAGSLGYYEYTESKKEDNRVNLILEEAAIDAKYSRLEAQSDSIYYSKLKSINDENK